MLIVFAGMVHENDREQRHSECDGADPHSLVNHRYRAQFKHHFDSDFSNPMKRNRTCKRRRPVPTGMSLSIIYPIMHSEFAHVSNEGDF